MRFSLRSFPLRTEPRRLSRGRLPSCRWSGRAHRFYELSPLPRLQGFTLRRSPLPTTRFLRLTAARCSLGLFPLQGLLPRRDGSGFPDPPPLRLPASRCEQLPGGPLRSLAPRRGRLTSREAATPPGVLAPSARLRPRRTVAPAARAAIRRNRFLQWQRVRPPGVSIANRVLSLGLSNPRKI